MKRNERGISLVALTLIVVVMVILVAVGVILLKNKNKEEVFTIIIPETYFEYSGGNVTEAAASYTELGEEFCTSAEAKDNDLIIEVTDKQRQNLIKRNNDYIEELVNDFKNSNTSYNVVGDQEYKELTIYADENFKPALLAKAILTSEVYMINNILENDNKDWSVYVKIVNCHTGKTVAEGILPQNDFSFGEEEWKASY